MTKQTTIVVTGTLRVNSTEDRNMSQCTTKSTIRLVQPAKTQISLCCLLQPPGYPKRDKRERLPYWVDVLADLSLLVTQVLL